LASYQLSVANCNRQWLFLPLELSMLLQDFCSWDQWFLQVIFLFFLQIMFLTFHMIVYQ